jgi:putative ABC transport system permease protein
MPYEADVIGIVGDVHRVALDQPAAAELFVPYRQSGFYALTLVVRTAPGSQATLQVLKEQVWALDPRQPIFHTGMLDDLISQSLVGRRFSALLLGGFALATLILAAAGVYGVMSFATSQRTRELGVRIALGASRRDIVSLVLKDGLAPTAVGLIVGLAVALPLTRTLRSLLYETTVTDPLTYAAVSLAIAFVAAVASYLPARRALEIDPVQTLRVDA